MFCAISGTEILSGPWTTNAVWGRAILLPSMIALRANAFGWRLQFTLTSNQRPGLKTLTLSPVLSLPFKGVFYYKIDTDGLIKLY